MARGWESKAVEEQREDPANAPVRSPKPVRSPEEQDRTRKREDLQLARKRIVADLGSARHPRHKELLERALAELDGRILALSGEV